jgi:hypothetical protein
VRAGALRAALIVGGALSLAGCGGGGGGSTAQTVVGGVPMSGMSASAIKQAEQIRTRLAAAGYVVHEVRRPLPFIRGPVDAAAASHGPQQTFLAVDKDTDQTYGRLYEQLASITKKAHARAVKNLPTTPETFRLLTTLSANIKSLGYREFNVLVFNTPDDASSYGKTNFAAQNEHVLALPGANDFDQYKTVGAVIYFMPVVESEGKVHRENATFDKLVAVAQGNG